MLVGGGEDRGMEDLTSASAARVKCVKLADEVSQSPPQGLKSLARNGS